jgi:hypothetical protein
LNATALRAKYLADGTPADASKPPFLISNSVLFQSQALETLVKAVP